MRRKAGCARGAAGAAVGAVPPAALRTGSLLLPRLRHSPAARRAPRAGQARAPSAAHAPCARAGPGALAGRTSCARVRLRLRARGRAGARAGRVRDEEGRVWTGEGREEERRKERWWLASRGEEGLP